MSIEAIVICLGVIAVVTALKYYGWLVSPAMYKMVKTGKRKYITFNRILNSNEPEDYIEVWYEGHFIGYFSIKEARRACTTSPISKLFNIYKRVHGTGRSV